jgi:hypothetical protein
MSEGENRRPFGRMILTDLAPAAMSVASPAGRRTGPPPGAGITCCRSGALRRAGARAADAPTRGTGQGATPSGTRSFARPCVTVFRGIAGISSVPLWPLPAQYRLLTRQGSDVGGNESAIGQRPMFPIDPPHVFRIFLLPHSFPPPYSPRSRLEERWNARSPWWKASVFQSSWTRSISTRPGRSPGG